MHNTCTVCGGNKIAVNNPVHSLLRLHPIYKLLIGNAFERRALHRRAHNLVRHKLVALLVALKRNLCGLWIKERANQVLCHNICRCPSGVWVIGFNHNILYIWAHTESHIAWKSPRSGCPGKEEELLPYPCALCSLKELLREGIAQNSELHCSCGILNIPVAARLVKFVRTQTCTGSRRIGLNGITLVEQPFVVNLFEQVPESLYIPVVIGNIRVLRIYPITYSLCKRNPLLSIFHHLLAAGVVIFLY